LTPDELPGEGEPLLGRRSDLLDTAKCGFHTRDLYGRQST
jgi:hypothetical protein